MLILFWQVVLGLINKWVAMELPMNCHLISGAINKILLVRNGRSTPREGHNLYLPQEKRSFGFSLQKFGGLKQPSSNGTFSFNGLKSCCWYCPVLYYTYLVPHRALIFLQNMECWWLGCFCPLSIEKNHENLYSYFKCKRCCFFRI